jgi:23S rRNA (cytosine1962-C5)-methyltransferase
MTPSHPPNSKPNSPTQTSTHTPSPYQRLTLKKGLDRRFQSGHPWVFSNEITQSPKKYQPGEKVRIDDASGKFLAYATVNPHSLIFARATSRSEKEVDALEEQGIHRRLNRSWKFRESLGRTKSSFRLCFGEADQLPGLIIDAFRIGPTLEQSELLFVIQPQTAGAEALLPYLQSWIQKHHSAAGTVIRREAQFRKQEGLEILEHLLDGL